MNAYDILIEYTEPQQAVLTVHAETQEIALSKLEENIPFDFEVLQIQEVLKHEEEVTSSDTIPNPTSNTRH